MINPKLILMAVVLAPIALDAKSKKVAQPLTVTAMMSSGLKEPGITEPRQVKIQFTFSDGTSYQTVAPVIENTDAGLRAAVNLKDVTSPIRSKFTKALKPSSDYIVIMPSGKIIANVGLEGGEEKRRICHWNSWISHVLKLLGQSISWAN